MKGLIPIAQNFLLRRGLIVAKIQKTSPLTQIVDFVWPTSTEIPLIRVGSTSRSDGGYLIPDDLDGVKRVFSPGVSKTMDFEQYFLDRGVVCEMIDGSVEVAPDPHPLANFQKLWLAADTDEGRICLDDWVERFAEVDEDLVLQMDIEGAEYEALASAHDSTLTRFRIIVLELHDLRSVMSRMGLALFLSTIRRLKRTHEIVHAHPNNCCIGINLQGQWWPDVMEITFLRKDRFVQNLGPASLPHHLDRDNTPNSTVVLSRKPRA